MSQVQSGSRGCGAGIHRVPFAVLLALALLLLPAYALAQETLRGVALVIGNGEYEHLPGLANPENDADAIEELLGDLGFDAIARTDRDAKDLARDLERFVEDAAEADVAVLYYAGHGIEAGGENFLVPVDADLSALDAAAERLVPLSAILARLRETVPVSILLLDACRDNPFPPGAQLRTTPAAAPLPVSAGGLAETRGARAVGEAGASAGNLGMVIGFAAEPGRPALDGDGGHSPYAAALLRHVSAMAGQEFGTVMRMVAEEVYLKTQGRQRPWTNESMRRLLYFGEPEPQPDGDQGAILKERRQLLVHMAALPDIGRRQVERVAADGGVPMDAVFGMLRAVGAEVTGDPGRLDAMLRAQSARLAEIMQERDVLTRTDPEIVRLASLAGAAIEEGALTAAIGFHERAKARVAALSRELDDVEAEIRERRMEFARVYAESAAAYELTFDFDAAAADYERAFAEIERWDDALSWEYRRRAIIAEYRHGEYMGDAAALERVLARRDETLRLAARAPSELARAEALLQIGNAFNILGKQRSDRATLEAAVTSYEEAIPIFEAGGEAAGVTRAKNNLASALTSLGANDADTKRLERAISIHRGLADAAPFGADTLDWMTARLNLASTLALLGERRAGTETMREAMQLLSGIVERVGPDLHPIPWALAKFNLAGTMLFVGEREGSAKMLADSTTAGREVLDIWTREAFPLYWASAHNNIGNAYQALGFGLDDETFLRAAEYEYRDALVEWRRDRVPDDWAKAVNNLANVLKKLGRKAGDPQLLEEAVAAYRDCMEIWTRADKPLSWASAQNNMGDGLTILGTLRQDPATLREAIAAFDLALGEWTLERVPHDWSVATNNRGGALIALGAMTREPETIRRGIADIEAAWKHDRDAGDTSFDDYYAARIADAKEALEKAGGG